MDISVASQFLLHNAVNVDFLLHNAVNVDFNLSLTQTSFGFLGLFVWTRFFFLI